VSIIKLRQAGFTKTLDTEDSFRKALQSLIDRKLLPPAQSKSDRRKPAEHNLEDLSPALMKS
jgi:non-homologous end joining protein Ku